MVPVQFFFVILPDDGVEHRNRSKRNNFEFFCRVLSKAKLYFSCLLELNIMKVQKNSCFIKLKPENISFVAWCTVGMHRHYVRYPIHIDGTDSKSTCLLYRSALCDRKG